MNCLLSKTQPVQHTRNQYSFPLLQLSRPLLARPVRFTVPHSRTVRMASSTEQPGVTDMDAHVAKAWEFFRSMGSPKYHVAPMVDQSELAFRQLCRNHGATCAYTPMLHSRLFVEDPKYRAEHFTTNKEDRPLLVQFCANDPGTLLAAAKLVQADCDAVDLNLGCPQRIAKKGNYGAFLMDDLPRVEAMVKNLYHGLDCPVTVKIRRFPELERTLEYARMLQAAGASVLAIHGRTREQKDASKVLADWAVIKAVKEALRIPVLGNGNIRDLADAQALMRETGVDGVLSAEPLLVNPALFSGVPVRGVATCQQVLEYLDICERPDIGATPFRMIKGHCHKILGPWFREHHDLRDRINKGDMDINKLRALAKELAARIEASGRDYPVEQLTERAKQRLQEQEAAEAKARVQAAIAEQRREDAALAALSGSGGEGAAACGEPVEGGGGAEGGSGALQDAEGAPAQPPKDCGDGSAHGVSNGGVLGKRAASQV